jgi:superfamily II DNA or RNA helicase
MDQAAPLSLRTGERVLVRDQAWRVEAVQPIGQGRSVVQLLPADGDHRRPLSVVVPPEDLLPLPTEDLRFDLDLLSPLGPWRRGHEAIRLTAVSEEGLLSGARFGRVALEAYQVAPVLRILAKPRPRLLIADDVGLGKTIEAGLCILELMARRRADRILIVVPPGLLDQWHDELLDKFGLEFALIENAAGLARTQTQLPAGFTAWEMLPRVLTSIDYLKKEDVRARALRRPWDLIVVDEAHALAESGTPQNPYRTQRTRLGYDPRGVMADLVSASRGLLLLTATPHNGYSHAFRSLIHLVEPTAATFGGAPERTRERIERAMVRRMKLQIVRRDAEGRWVEAFLRRSVEAIRVPLTEAEKTLFKKVSAYCSRTARDAEGGEDADLISFAMQIIKKRMLSSRRALAKTLDNRLKALKQEAAQEAPPERSELRDLQADLPLSEATAERIAQRVVRSAIPKDERRRKAEIRKLTEIQRLFKKLPERDPKVADLMAHLRGVLGEEPEAKVIVFTEYVDTLEAIAEAFDGTPDLQGTYGILRGGWSRSRRRRAQAGFESAGIRFLLATDAASEGLNLQRACHRIVHFELPWNPNRLEQRNGRVDRYGQTLRPEIRYLYFPDSPEDHVLAGLVRKIEEMQGDRVSTPDILGILAGAEALERALVTLDAEQGDHETRARGLVRLFEDRTAEFVRSVKPLIVTGRDVRAEIETAERMLQMAEPLLPDDLDLERFLADVLGPAKFRPTDAEGIYRVTVPRVFQGPDVAAAYPRATCRRSIAVKTQAAEVEFLTPLHPLLRAIAEDARRRLLYVYPDEIGLPAKRLAARRMAAPRPPAILFTFLGLVEGNGVIEERLVTVRFGLDGTVQADEEEDRALLADTGPPGEVPAATLQSLFIEVFDRLYQQATEEAARRLAARVRAIQSRRAEEARLLREDMLAYAEDRRRELDEEERLVTGREDRATGQQFLWAAQPRATGLDARRAAIDTFVNRRQEEIAEFETVRDPAPPRPLGALFLVPEGTEARA